MLLWATALMIEMTIPTQAQSGHSHDLATIVGDYKEADTQFCRRNSEAAADNVAPIYTHVGLNGKERFLTHQDLIAHEIHLFTEINNISAQTQVTKCRFITNGAEVTTVEVEHFTLTIHGNTGTVDAQHTDRSLWMKAQSGHWLEERTVQLLSVYHLNGYPIADPFTTLRSKQPDHSGNLAALKV